MKNKWFKYIYLEKYRWLIAIIFTCVIAAAILGYYTPMIIAKLYNSYGSKEMFQDAFFTLAIFFITEYINRVIYQLCVNKYVQKLLLEVRGFSYKNWLLNYEIIKTGQNEKDRYPLGEVMARIISDTESVRELVTTGSFAIVIDVVFIASCLFSFIKLNTVSGFFLILAEVSACIFLIWGSQYMARIFMQVRTATGMLSRTLANIVNGIRQIYYTPDFDYTLKVSQKTFDDFLNKQLKANVWDASYYSIAESLFPILVALLVIIFPYSQIVEVAIFAAIIDLLQRSIAPIKDVTAKLSNIQRARAGFIRMDEFNTDLLSSPFSKVEKVVDDFEFQHLNVEIKKFEYDLDGEKDKKFFLKDIHFEGSKGELIGLVGLSGSGKTTLLKILSSQILCEQCQITLTGVNSRSIVYSGKIAELNQYKEYVSLVSQDSHIFTESLEFNITMGKGRDFTSFWQRMLEFLPYLSKWQVGPETLIDPREISMGQKQLISALRSCYLRKSIVLFDEISSGMDSDLESALRHMMLYIQKQSLTIIVAHRVETILNADKIIVLDQGRKVSEGRHKELLKSSSIYAEFISKLKSLT